MGPLKTLEDKLVPAFTKNAPVQLPENVKKFIVKYLPIVNLVLGVLSLLATLSLWSWANTTTRIIDNVNTVSAIYGGKETIPNRLSMLVWLSLIVAAATAVLYIAAYPGTKAKKKSGWNLLFYAVLLNLVYGVVNAFTDYGSVRGLIGTLVGTIIGLFFLFQIRSYYTASGEKSSTTKAKNKK